jgi:vacuolar-type H+-ATPase subunit I/STV1
LDGLTPVETPAPKAVPAHSIPTPPPSLRGGYLPSTSPSSGSNLPGAPSRSSSPLVSTIPSVPDGKVQELLSVISEREKTIQSLQDEKQGLEAAAKEAEELRAGRPHSTPLLILAYSRPYIAATRHAGSMREEQHKTATLRARLQETQPQLKELAEVKQNLAALENARASLLASLKQLEEDNNSMFIIKYA